MESYLSQLHEFQMMRRKETGDRAFVTFLQVISTAERFFRIPETMISGLGLKEPTLFYSSASGVKSATVGPQHLSDFVGLCSHHSQTSSLHPPFSITCQSGPCLLTDAQMVTSTWNKALSRKKDIILQRFISSAGPNQKTYYVTWRPNGYIVLSATAKTPFLEARQKETGTRSSVEDVFLPRKDKMQPEMIVQDGLQEVVLGIVDVFMKRFEGEHYSELEEIIIQCMQDRSQQWVILRIRSFQLGRKMKALGQLRLQTESFGQIRTNLKPNARRSSTTKLKTVKFGLSPAIVDVKRLIGLPVSAFEMQQALKNYKQSRVRSISTAPTNAKRRHLPAQPKSVQDTEPVASAKPAQVKKPEDMPPIFQFPTPKATFEPQNALESIPHENRISVIREHIARQNNSLFMRIHFQEELPEKRMMQDLFTQSMDRAVVNLETLRLKAKHLRTHSHVK